MPQAETVPLPIEFEFAWENGRSVPTVMWLDWCLEPYPSSAIFLRSIGNRSPVGVCPPPRNVAEEDLDGTNSLKSERCGEGLGEGKPARSLCLSPRPVNGCGPSF